MKKLALKRLLRISRPRFWIYLFGPFLIGIAAALGRDVSFQTVLLNWRVWVFGVFFLFPANLLVYGVNDVFDYETDKDNPKKQEYEALVLPTEHAHLWQAIGITTLPFLLGLFGAKFGAHISMACFLFFSIGYSAPPIRAKAKPFLDAAFNVLYVFPGLMSYFLLQHPASFPWASFFAASFWCMAMHAYSAVPDIWADRMAKVRTIATTLGRQRTLWLCLALYAAAGIIASQTKLGIVGSILGAGYVGLMITSLLTKDAEELLVWYRRFPLINTVCGAILFFALIGF
jgi:4-hydroxybenzoate polyprenyltransferase